MHNESISCIAGSRIQASRAVNHLINAGFAHDEISMLLSCGASPGGEGGSQNSQLPFAAFATMENEAGGLVGWLANLGFFSLPGLGRYLAAGPICDSLGGPTARVSIGKIVKALRKLGLSRSKAGLFYESAAQGHILISVLARSPRELEAANRIFHAIGAIQIVSTEPRRASIVSRFSSLVGTLELKEMAG